MEIDDMNNGVIIAAGRGSRLKNLTDKIPKGMVNLEKFPLLFWQSLAMNNAGIKNVNVITGYRSEVISDYGFSTIKNDNWNKGNMLISIELALKQISSPLIISYSDIIYHSKSINLLINDPSPISITYDINWKSLWLKRFDNPLIDAETFRVDSNGYLLEIGNKTNNINEIEGQFMGILKINETGKNWILKMLNENKNYKYAMDTTKLLQDLINNNFPIKAIANPFTWCEIDTKKDLALAEEMIKQGSLKLPEIGTAK